MMIKTLFLGTEKKSSDEIGIVAQSLSRTSTWDDTGPLKFLRPLFTVERGNFQTNEQKYSLKCSCYSTKKYSAMSYMYDLKGNRFKLNQVYNFSETGFIVNALSFHINSTINLLRIDYTFNCTCSLNTL